MVPLAIDLITGKEGGNVPGAGDGVTDDVPEDRDDVDWTCDHVEEQNCWEDAFGGQGLTLDVRIDGECLGGDSICFV